MKGLELPINMIVVVAIAVLVLVVVAAFFSGWLVGGTGTIATSAAYSNGCNTLRSVYGCDTASVTAITISGYNPFNRPSTPTAPFAGENLGVACNENFKTTMTPEACARTCGCGTASTP